MNVIMLCVVLGTSAVSIQAMEFSMSPARPPEKVVSPGVLNQSLSPTLTSEASNGSDLLDERTPVFKLGSPPRALLKSVPQTPREIVVSGMQYYEKNDYAGAFTSFTLIIERLKTARPISMDLAKAAATANLYAGQMLLEGHGMPRNEQAAHQHLKSAAVQNNDYAVVCKSVVLLSKLYDKYMKFAQSIVCLTRAIKGKKFDPESAAEAYLLLGMHYADGEGFARNNALAQYNYQKAEKQSVNLSISLAAKFLLCDMVYQNKAVLFCNQYYMKNQIALNYCDAIIAQSGSSYPAYRAKARLRRGVLYAEGGYGIQKDLQRAQIDLNYVLNQSDDLEAAQEAKVQLDDFGLRVID